MIIRRNLISLLIRICFLPIICSTFGCENPISNFEIFIKELEKHSYTINMMSFSVKNYLRFERSLTEEEKKDFISFLSATKKISPPSAGSLDDVFYFYIADSNDEPWPTKWKIEIKRNHTTGLFRFAIDNGMFNLFHRALDEPLTKELVRYLMSLEVEME